MVRRGIVEQVPRTVRVALQDAEMATASHLINQRVDAISALLLHSAVADLP